MLTYTSVLELIEATDKAGKNISEVVLEDQALQADMSREEIFNKMESQFKVMQEAIQKGLKANSLSPSGMSGCAAIKMKNRVDEGKMISGSFLGKALANALAVSEVNAAMGRIVAAPTAGSSGILPSVLFAMMEEQNIPSDKIVMSLFTAAGIGMVIAARASISGAEGGCMAECGSASAMAAAAMVELAGGTPRMAAHACAIALKNTMGLVCDPVAGLVEVPCVKRNAGGAANAIASAELALAGIESFIPVDEVIDAMKHVGEMLPSSLRETAEGGLAATQTGRKAMRHFYTGMDPEHL